MPLVKAQIIVKHTGEKIPVAFNPEEYTINRDNNFATQGIPGLSAPLLQFVHGNQRTLEMELFFDTYDTNQVKKQDVRDLTGRVIRLMDIDSALHAPPVLRFSWASLQFDCVLARAGQKFILFTEDGTPVRARLTVTFNEYIDTLREAKQVNRQTADFTKVHVLAQGETLSGVAGRLYGNPQAWRPIAIASGIDNPHSLRAGQQILVPPLPFNDPQSGEVIR